MNATNAKVQSVLETTFTTAVGKMVKDEAGNLISDIYVQADPENGELQIFDDEEHLIEKTIIFDWVNNQEAEERFNERVSATIKAVLTILSTKNVFNHSRFMRPLSVSLTDEDFVVVEELLFLDDDTIRLDDPLLKDLDADLDDFLLKLLSDVN